MTDQNITLDTATTMGPAALLTPAETAQVLRVSERTLERWRTVGEGPAAVRIGPRRLMYRVGDILRFAGAESADA